MSDSYAVAALYRFVRLDDYVDLRLPLLDFMLAQSIRGTVLLASEGINGTVAGRTEAIQKLLEYLRTDTRLADLDCKLSYTKEIPFYRSRVKLKKEIVTMGLSDLDPAQTGQYVQPRDWNALISDPAVTVIDTRNDYESSIGSFANAKPANTTSFREFPDYVNRHLNPRRHRKIAMFCTGGIRCEKSTAYLRQQGFDEVYQLQGGILKYLEEVPQRESLWQGECFVFDNRVSVDHALQKGSYEQCHACRRPISRADQDDPRYRPGICCPHCHAERNETDRTGFSERQKQIELAASRGEQHIGADAEYQGKLRKSLKLAAKNRQRQASRAGTK